MRVLVIGGSGRTGKRVVTSAIRDGHEVTALVRSPTSLSEQQGPTLHVMEGTPLNVDTQPAGPPEIVFSALAFPLKPMVSEHFMRDTLTKVIGVMRRFKVQRLIVFSAFGVGESADHLAWPLKLVFRYTKMAYGYQDHTAVEKMLQAEQGIKWTLVKPPMLRDEDAATDVRTFDSNGSGVGMLDSCTMGSVAAFMTKQAVADKWVEQTVVIAN
ncbi:hypothetical protein KC316_g5772 [Hortaea werneckii]|nr:hypothetical protein KC324_g6355 [Hortaea werneckii]KAI7586160.1 hypothetical protein KC316_g5772 [Hortaea werneckii]